MTHATPTDPMPLPLSFYDVEAEALARKMVGTVLVRRVGGKILRGRIVETEAYVGEHDLACHAAKGRTPRTEALFGRAGKAYVYLIYGMHYMLNVVAGPEGRAQGVLIRAAEPLDGWDTDLTGPGKVARGFCITRADYGRDLTTDPSLFVQADPRLPPVDLALAPRVGVDYAGDWVHALLRFYDRNSAAVSKRPKDTPAATRRKATKATRQKVDETLRTNSSQ